MTVASSTRSAGPFNGNDVTTEFPFAFKVFASTDVAVYFTGTDGVQTLLADGYTVSLNADQDSDPGGTVTYPASGDPLATGESLSIIGGLAYKQETDLTNSGRFLPQVVEAALDYLTILCQQLLERMERKLSLPVGDAGETELPTSSERAGNFLAFDADGNPIAAAGTTEVPVSAFAATLLDDATAADARTTLGATATGASLFTAATAADAFAGIKQAATESASGVVELATSAEAKAGTDTERAVTPATMKAAQIQASVAVASTSGAAIDFTGIPSWAKRITVMFAGVSTNGTSAPIVQLGDSGGIEPSGYVGGAASIVHSANPVVSNYTTGFGIAGSVTAATVWHGAMTISLVDAATNTWAASWSGGLSTPTLTTVQGGGSKALSAALDRIRITTVGGTEVFDAGLVNILIE